MNKKQIILKLIIYIIFIVLAMFAYHSLLPLTKPMSRGWGEEDIIVLPKNVLIVVCIVWSLLFTILAIKEILKLKKKKK